MMAGHTLLYIFASFTAKAISGGGISFILSIIGIFLLIVIIIMEFIIAFLQVYVFATLFCIYLVDIHNVNHLGLPCELIILIIKKITSFYLIKQCFLTKNIFFLRNSLISFLSALYFLIVVVHMQN